MTGPLIKISRWDPSDRKQAILDFWKELAPVVVRAVEDSFKVAEMVNITRTELSHRIKLAKEIVEEMRDLRWGKIRIKDQLGPVLAARLVGIAIDLETLGLRSTW